jgi:outer membrane protein, heavy metal efflux system
MKIQGLNLLLLIFLAITGVWSTGCATSAPPSPQWKLLEASTLTEPLTIERCLQLAWVNDIQAAQWKARLDIAHAELIDTKALPNPSFGITWDDIGLHDDEGANVLSTEYGFSYPLFFWVARDKKIAAAKANSQVEVEKVLSEQRQLTVEIASAYLGLVADQRREKLIEHLLQLTDESMRLISKQKELQMVSNYELDRVRAEQLKIQSDLLDAHSQLRLDQLAFAFAIGVDKPCYPVVEDCNDIFIQSLSSVVSDQNIPESVIQNALQADPGWREKKAAVIAASNRLQVEKSNTFPLADDASVSGGPKDTPEGWGSMFSFEIPIPIFNRNKGGIRRAQAELTIAQVEEEKARRDAIAVVAQAWERYRTLSIRWNQYTKALNELAQKNELAASKLFAAGQIEYDEFLIAQRDNKQAQLDSLNTWLDTSTAAWRLSCVLGQHDLPEDKSN